MEYESWEITSEFEQDILRRFPAPSCDQFQLGNNNRPVHSVQGCQILSGVNCCDPEWIESGGGEML
jgi:hypothetical protein